MGEQSKDLVLVALDPVGFRNQEPVVDFESGFFGSKASC